MPLSLHVVFWLSTAIDLGTAAFVLFRLPRLDPRQSGTITLPRMGLAAALTGAVFTAKLVFLVPAGVDPFGVIHLLYLDLVVAAPILGGLLLAAPWPRRKGVPRLHITAPARLAAIGLALLALVGVYATWVEPFRLQLEQAARPLPAERRGAQPLRVGVLADIQTAHVTNYERGAVERLMALQPDVIVLPGDLFQGTAAELQRELPALRELVGRLWAPGGVYFVMGDVDTRAGVERVFADSSVRILLNRLDQISVGDRVVTIGGLGLDVHTTGAQQVIRQLESDPRQGDVRLLVAHRPDAVLSLRENSRIDLVIAGHTHGGQVQLPFLGPPLTLSAVPRHVAAGGLHEVGPGRWVYVSRGLGWEHDQAPRIRFLCPPEVSVIELA